MTTPECVQRVLARVAEADAATLQALGVSEDDRACAAAHLQQLRTQARPATGCVLVLTLLQRALF